MEFNRDYYMPYYGRDVVYMLTIKHKVMLRKYYRLLDKRNEAFSKGEYKKATYYGELANKYLTDVLKMEDGVSV